jgi:short-subunit dehydrogenase
MNNDGDDDDKQLAESYEVVRSHLIENDIKLLALVNNAGFGYYSPIEAASIDKFKKMMEGM